MTKIEVITDAIKSSSVMGKEAGWFSMITPETVTDLKTKLHNLARVPHTEARPCAMHPGSSLQHVLTQGATEPLW